VYTRHFGLRERPFSLLPDPAFLYPSEKHRTAMALFEYGLLQQAGFAVLSGGVGTGKTTLVQGLLGRIGGRLNVGLITNTSRSLGAPLDWVLAAFALSSGSADKLAMFRAFEDLLTGEYAKGRRSLLIVDEAQNLAAEALEDLRMLSNLNAGKHQLLQVFLVGQPGLRAMLQRPELEQLAQRIAADYHLEPLHATETRGYIRHRLAVAGGDPNTIEDEACEAVYRASGGVPRVINLLCDLALVYGYARRATRIGAQTVEEVVKDKRKGGIFPSPPSLTPLAAGPATAIKNRVSR
jgi:type II secretory pathway predicted ATPase ExeA